jgi:hypothetical protein
MSMQCIEAKNVDVYKERRDNYARAYGPVFKPLRVTCGNASCVNPAHVRISSHQELGREMGLKRKHGGIAWRGHA